MQAARQSPAGGAVRADVGTSGWNYPAWRAAFYGDCPARLWLVFCAERFGAIEFRHESWFDGQVADCLREHGIAACQSDAADWPLWDAVTTDLVYVRLHGHPLTYASGYSETQLRDWAARVRRWLGEGREVHVYFDNDALGRAPADALRLIALLETPAPGRRTPAGSRRPPAA